VFFEVAKIAKKVRRAKLQDGSLKDKNHYFGIQSQKP
jgi:hypothetical protein